MRYQIKVQGQIDPSWSEWFSGIEVSTDAGGEDKFVTSLTGPVEDQAALRGILNRLWDLNLTILSVIQLEPQGEKV